MIIHIRTWFCVEFFFWFFIMNIPFILVALDVYCASSVDAKIAHPRICSRYYDCKLTRPRENFNKYEGECRYPLLYSERYQRCIDFSDVQCGSKIEPLSPCKFLYRFFISVTSEMITFTYRKCLTYAAQVRPPTHQKSNH